MIIMIYSHRLVGQECCGECRVEMVAEVRALLVCQVGWASADLQTL